MQHLQSEACQLFSSCRAHLSALCVWQKIEAIDEDEDADDDFVTSDLEQMQNLLEFKVKARRRIKHSSCCARAETPRSNSSALEALQPGPQVLNSVPSSVSARGSAVLGERAREPKTKVPAAGRLHEEPAQCCEEQRPGQTAGALWVKDLLWILSGMLWL